MILSENNTPLINNNINTEDSSAIYLITLYSRMYEIYITYLILTD